MAKKESLLPHPLHSPVGGGGRVVQDLLNKNVSILKIIFLMKTSETKKFA
jgi:hypothetical protein